MACSLKDIRETLNSLRMEGRHVEELEALLIHTDDLRDLLKSIPEHLDGTPGDGIRILGVTIVESRYTKKGTIFRIFKTDDRLYETEGYFQGTIPASGSLNITPDETSFGKIVHMPDNMKLPTMADKKKEEKKQKRHSNKRKIELD